MNTKQLFCSLSFCGLGAILIAGNVAAETIAKSAASTHKNSSAHKNSSKPDKNNDRAPYDAQMTRQLATFWEERVRDDPKGGIALRELAGAYLSRGRETGDISYAVRAEKAARQSLEVLSAKGNAVALIRLSRSLLTQHRFPEALETADQAAVINVEAQRLRADIAIELGNRALAAEAMAKIPAEPDDLARKKDLNYQALRAHLLESQGNWSEALTLRKSAARQSEEFADMPAETAGWYHTMVGHAQIDHGQLVEGEQNCRRALEIFPLDYRAMTGLAEAAAWRESWKDAINWGKKAIRIAPENPGVLLLLGNAYEKLGNLRESKQQYQLFEKLAASFPRIYDRHWILFSADSKQNLGKALALARRDLKLRQDAGAYDALAWTCYKAGLLAEAKKTIQQALDNGGNTASILYHAGMIAHASGERKQADNYFAKVKAFNPYYLKTVSLPKKA